MSLALGQPRGCTGASLGSSKARDIFGTLRPSPEKTTCSFPYRFSPIFRGIQGIWGLHQAIGIPMQVLSDPERTLSCDPPPGLAEESKNSPAQKANKSLWQSLRGVTANPSKRAKNESSGETLRVKSAESIHHVM